MTRVFGVLALTFLTMLASDGFRSTGQKLGMGIKLHYVSIGVETLVPVIPDEIEQKGRYCEIDSTRDIERIRGMLVESVIPSATAFSDRSTQVQLNGKGNALIALIDN